MQQGEPPYEIVDGLIKRVNLTPEISGRLRQSSPMRKAEIYRSQEIWYDYVAVLANLKLKSSNPGDVQKMWDTALSNLGLPELTGEPFVPAIEPESNNTVVSACNS